MLFNNFILIRSLEFSFTLSQDRLCSFNFFFVLVDRARISARRPLLRGKFLFSLVVVELLKHKTKRISVFVGFETNIFCQAMSVFHLDSKLFHFTKIVNQNYKQNAQNLRNSTFGYIFVFSLYACLIRKEKTKFIKNV